VAVVIQRFEVYLVSLDPTVGSEIQKSRPCLVISPDEMNRYINTVIVAPMTTKGRDYGWFTEGFDTADLQEARTLLNELL
jgi:mRNA interferase MazF